nr:EOG090X07IA [Eulimnadia texana]
MRLLPAKLRRLKWYHVVGSIVFTIVALDYVGAFAHLREVDYHSGFSYPLDIDLAPLVSSLRKNEQPAVKPINTFNYTYLKSSDKCSGGSILRFAYVIKSAMNHFERRQAIRDTWGYEQRFSDVPLRRVFVLGISDSNSELQHKIDEESDKHGDIVQVNFIDSYWNNSVKTMAAMKWTVEKCSNARFLVFADDDMYLSTKNLLKFLRNPEIYPDEVFDYLEDQKRVNGKLYAGYVFHSPPLRHKFSKWYVPLEEYPFTLWPPYATAGAYVLSRTALLELYYGSMFTKMFRFDDVYLGLVARKVGLEPLHCSEFYFWKKPYSATGYRDVIASHGFGDPQELRKVWTEQKSLGNA